MVHSPQLYSLPRSNTSRYFRQIRWRLPPASSRTERYCTGVQTQYLRRYILRQHLRTTKESTRDLEVRTILRDAFQMISKYGMSSSERSRSYGTILATTRCVTNLKRLQSVALGSRNFLCKGIKLVLLTAIIPQKTES